MGHGGKNLRPVYCQTLTSFYISPHCYEILPIDSGQACQEIVNFTSFEQHVRKQKDILVKRMFFCAHVSARRMFFQNARMDKTKVKICKFGSATSSANMFRCKNDEFISKVLVCNGKPDCQHNDDEAYCTCTQANDLQQKSHIHCSSHFQKRCGCGDLCFSHHNSCTFFDKSVKALFFKVSEQMSVSRIRKSDDRNFSCWDGAEIKSERFNDLIPDCSSSEDEPELAALGNADNIIEHCVDPFLLPCIPGHSKCYHVKQKCHYRVNTENILDVCRNGAHLAECKAFECPRLFKCFRSYCLPDAYVCDGKFDCPEGMDETKCPLLCVFSFKCGHATLCLHFDCVCDGSIDCPNGDDEFLCDLPECQSQCVCLGLAIRCQKEYQKLFSSFLSISISEADISSVDISVPSCVFLQMTNNRFSNGTSIMLSDVDHLRLFKFNENHLDSIFSLQIISLSLKKFLLTKNCLTSVPDNSFRGIPRLKVLDLSENQISSVGKFAFSSLKCLQFVSLVGNKLQQIDVGTFSMTEAVNTVLFDLGSLCCQVSERQCFHLQTERVVCQNILFTSQKIVCTAFVFLLFSVNSASHISMKRNQREKSGFECLMDMYFCLSLLLCLYLIIILSADAHFNTGISGTEGVWVGSFWCSLSFFALACNLQGSIFVSVALALSRTMVTKYPFNSKFMKHAFVRRVNSLAMLFAVIVTSLVLLCFHFLHEGANGLQILCVSADSHSFEAFYIAIGILEFVTPVALCFLYFLLVKEFTSSSAESSSTCDVTSDIVIKVVFEILINITFRSLIGAGCVLVAVTHSEAQLTGTWILLLSMCSQMTVEPLHTLIKRLCVKNKTNRTKLDDNTGVKSGTSAACQLDCS